MNQSRTDAGVPESFGRFAGRILLGAIACFAALLLISVAIVAATQGSQAASDYTLGLAQTWFIVALYCLFWLVGAFVVGAVAWVLKGAPAWARLPVIGCLGSLASLYLIAPVLLQAAGASAIGIQVVLAGLLPGLAFGVFAAVAAGRHIQLSS